MKKRKPPKQSRIGASESEAATHFQVSKTTIGKWKSKGWAVCFNDGSIDLDSTAKKVNDARDARGGKPDRLAQPHESYSTGDASNKPEDIAPAPGDPPTLIEARTKKERALARKAELEVARLEGSLIAVEDARKVYVSVVTSARVALEAVPARVAPRLVGLTSAIEIRRIVQTEIAAALRSLSDDPPDVE